MNIIQALRESFASSNNEANRFIKEGSVKVNGSTVDRNYECKLKDIITIGKRRIAIVTADGVVIQANIAKPELPEKEKPQQAELPPIEYEASGYWATWTGDIGVIDFYKFRQRKGRGGELYFNWRVATVTSLEMLQDAMQSFANLYQQRFLPINHNPVNHHQYMWVYCHSRFCEVEDEVRSS